MMLGRQICLTKTVNLPLKSNFLGTTLRSLTAKNDAYLAILTNNLDRRDVANQQP